MPPWVIAGPWPSISRDLVSLDMARLTSRPSTGPRSLDRTAMPGEATRSSANTGSPRSRVADRHLPLAPGMAGAAVGEIALPAAALARLLRTRGDLGHPSVFRAMRRKRPGKQAPAARSSIEARKAPFAPRGEQKNTLCDRL